LDSITSPISPILIQNQAVKVRLVNGGLVTMTSATINWKVDNISQTPFAWTGSLVTGAVANNVSIGTFNFAPGAHIIKAWVSNPNGVADQFALNDTVTSTVIACSSALKGVYTIGGATANFPDFATAVSTLNSCGIDSNVVFNVNAGIYNEQITIGVVPGVDPTKTVTFKSTNNDSTAVILTSGVGSFVLKLNGASYTNFKNISIVATNSTSGTAVMLMGGAHHNNFSNNIIKGVTVATSTVRAIDLTSGSNENYNSIINNKIEGGYYGIYSYGTSSSSWEKGTIIQGNDVSGFYYYGITSYYSDSTQIIGNYVHDGTNATQYGIQSYYSNNGYRIMNNRIVLTPTTVCMPIIVMVPSIITTP
jgi:hypothetical protein